MLNMVQYIILGIVPIILVLKGIKHYVPEEDDTKGTPEVAIEAMMQLIVIMKHFVLNIIRIFFLINITLLLQMVI